MLQHYSNGEKKPTRSDSGMSSSQQRANHINKPHSAQILRVGGENNENFMLFIFNIANIIHSYAQTGIFHLSSEFSALT